jgi:hypothetical protein
MLCHVSECVRMSYISPGGFMKNNYRSRKHMILLYPENPAHVDILTMIKLSYTHLGILHDRDSNDDGKIKKAHWHVLIETKNATYASALIKEFGLEPNLIQQVRNQDSALCYLIHYMEENKFQYMIDDLFGSPSLIKKLESAIEKNNGKSEGEKVSELIEFIENADRKISITSFAKYCALQGRWDVFRRSGMIFVKMIEEKNNSLLSE